MKVIDQLRDLFGGALFGFVFGGHPDFGGLFNNLFSDGMHASIEPLGGFRTCWAGGGLFANFGEKLIERLHTLKVTVRFGLNRALTGLEHSFSANDGG